VPLTDFGNAEANERAASGPFRSVLEGVALPAVQGASRGGRLQAPYARHSAIHATAQLHS